MGGRCMAMSYAWGLASTVFSWSHSSALMLKPPEASPHKRRLKCVTNISPRRLMTHLLHQMVHHRTTLRGTEQISATIARITIHTHATMLNTKRGSSEYCAMQYLLRVTLIHRQGWVQDGTLLNVLWNEVWVFLCKNLEWGEYKRTQQVQPHPRRGYKQNIMHRVNQG